VGILGREIVIDAQRCFGSTGGNIRRPPWGLLCFNFELRPFCNLVINITCTFPYLFLLGLIVPKFKRGGELTF